MRIIDVNYNRATEGLRVVEEVCRFILEDRRLTLKVKKLRGALFKIVRISEKLIKARKSGEDVGRELYTKDEGRRTDVAQIFHANMKRAQEAVRCLEEFSKLINPTLGKKFKKIRFELYELEKIIALRITRHLLLDFDLYVITDPRRDHVKTVRKAIASGVKIIQLRDKTIGKQEYLRLAKKIARITRRKGVTFILNDYWDLVRKVGADGVHLGQEDLAHLSLRRVRKELGEDKIIGISTHSLAQAKRAEKARADYISFGPIFSTPSKPGVKPVGLGLLRKVVRRIRIPVVAIGGINEKNLKQVLRTGVKRIAVIRAIVGAGDIKKAVKKLRSVYSG